MAQQSNSNRSNESNKSRGKYLIIDADNKLIIAKQSDRIGIQQTINKYKEKKLKYNTVFGWRKQYRKAKAILGTNNIIFFNNKITTNNPIYFLYCFRQ